MKIVSNEDYLHEVSNPIFWINWDNNHFIACWISPESDKRLGIKYHPTPKKEMVWHFLQSISIANNLHEMSNPIFWGKFNKYHQFFAAEVAQRVEKVKG